MGYYYSYRIGIELDGKIYPYGPFNSNGKLCDVVSRSRSFASDLHEMFTDIPKDMFSDKLIETDILPDDFPTAKYIRLSDLPTGDYIKRGYFLIEDVKRYEEDNSLVGYEIFFDHLSPEVYSAMMQNEAMFGKPKQVLDSEGNDITPHSASDYMYYAYPDYSCKEYEAFLIREVAEMLSYFDWDTAGGKLVVILTEG